MLPMRRSGFTLVELMVVVLIILLVSAALLPSIIPAIRHRQVTEAARLLQGGLIQARAAATKANAPRGIRLLPDPTYANSPTVLAFNRWVQIEPGPPYSSGHVTVWPVPQTVMVFNGGVPPYPVRNPDGTSAVYPYYPPTIPTSGQVSPNNPSYGQVLMIEQSPFLDNDTHAGFDNPTGWFWNVRIGDKIKLGQAGQSYTVVGPMTVANPELFVNDDVPGAASHLTRTYTDAQGSTPITVNPEYLFIVNGLDDNRDGYVDQGFDGIDEGIDVAGGGFAGLDGTVDNVAEWEIETWLSSLSRWNVPASDAFYTNGPIATPKLIEPPILYTITRRPVISANTPETSLPTNIVIDATTWDSSLERSRLPVDPIAHTVDLMLNPNGQAIVSTVYSSPTSFGERGVFWHFWITERTDVFEPVVQSGVGYALPMPGSASSYPVNGDQSGRQLRGERLLLTLFGRTGQVATNSLEDFNGRDTSAPFYTAQLGARIQK